MCWQAMAGHGGCGHGCGPAPHLKVVHLPDIILVDSFREERDGVPDEEVGDVEGHLFIHVAVQQLLFNLLVVHQRNVVVPAVGGGTA